MAKKGDIIAGLLASIVSFLVVFFLVKSKTSTIVVGNQVTINAVYNGQNFDLSPIIVNDQTTGQQIAQGTSPLTLPLSDFNSTDNYTASVYYCNVPSLFQGIVSWTGIPPPTLTINVTRRTIDHCPE
jgi:hypothetical protein